MAQVPKGFLPDEGSSVPEGFVPDQAGPGESSGGYAHPYQRLADVAAGVLKGLGNTAIGLGDMAGQLTLNDLLGPAGRLLPDMRLNQVTGGTPEMFQSAREEWTTPTNAAQSLGKNAEQIAEFFLPAGAVARGANMATTVLPRTLARAGTEALSAGAVTSAQGGDPTTAAVVAGAAPVVSRVVRPVAGRLKSTALEQVEQALGGTKERFKAIAGRRAPDVLERGIVGSREGILAKASEQAKRFGQQIDDALQQQATQPHNPRPIIDALEDAKQHFVDTSVSPPVVLDERPVQQLTQLQGVIQQYGTSVSTESLVKLRRAWDLIVDQAGGFAHRAGGAIGVPLQEKSEAWAKREGAAAIRTLLAQDSPELAALNQEFSFWADIRNVLRQTVQRTKPQEKGLIEKMVGATAGGGTMGGMLAAGSGLAPAAGAAVLTGIAGRQLVKAMKSPLWKTVSAQAKSKLADALMSGSQERINLAVGRIVAATSGGATTR